MATNNVQYVISLDDKLTAGLNRAGGSVDTFQDKIMSAGRALGITLAAGAVAAGIKTLGSEIISLADKAEQAQIAFQTMLGSNKAGDQLLQQIKDFAVETPFATSQAIDLSKQILAYGIEAEKVIPTMSMLGDISSGVGMDKLPNLVLAFGQVKAATRLTGNELRQFTEAGVPLLDMLAKQTGKSATIMKDEISKGAVSFEMVEKAMLATTQAGGKFYNLMARQSKTIGGLWSTFTDKMQMAGAELGTRFMPEIKRVENGLIRFADKLLGVTKIQLSEKLEQEQAGLMVLANRLMDANTKEEERGRIISELNLKYPEFLKGLKTEEITTENIAKRLAETNKQYISRIILQKKEEEINKLQQESAQEYVDAIDTRNRISEKIAKRAVELGISEKLIGQELNDQMTIIKKAEAEQNNFSATRSISSSEYIEAMAAIAVLERNASIDAARANAIMKERIKLAKQFGVDIDFEKKGGLEVKVKADMSALKDSEAYAQITAQAPKVFNININKLVETINNNVSNLTESMADVKKVVVEALMDSLNQTQIVAR